MSFSSEGSGGWGLGEQGVISGNMEWRRNPRKRNPGFGHPNVGLSRGTTGKEPACQLRRHKKHRFNPLVGKIPWRNASYTYGILYLNKYRSENITLFIIVTDILKCLQNNLPRNTQGLSGENFQTLVKNTEDDLNKWSDFVFNMFLVRWFNSIKLSILPKLTYQFNAIPIKILYGFFVEELGKILHKDFDI